MRTTGRRDRSTLTWPLLVVGTGYLYFFAGGYFGIYAVGVRVASVGLIAIVFGTWAISAARAPRWRPASVLWPAIATGLLALTVATMTSRNTRISLDYLSYAAILAGLYLLLRQILAHDSFRNRMAAVMVVLTVVLAIAYLLAVLSRWMTWWSLVGALLVPPLRPLYEGLSFGNPGAVAVLAVMGLVISAAHLGFATGRARAALALIALLVAVVVLITGSRASWVAIAFTAALAVAIAFGQERYRRGLLGRLRSRQARQLLVLGAILFMALAIVAGPRVIERFLTGGTENARASFAVVAVRMFLQAPLTGFGPGMWPSQRIAYTVAPEIDGYIPHAHNVYLQTAAELGVMGLAAGVLAFACVAILVRRALTSEDPTRHRWAMAAIIVTAYFGIHQLFDMFVNMPTALLVFAMPIAWLDAMEPHALVQVPALGNRLRHSMLGAGVALVALAIAWSGVAERSALLMDEGQSAIEQAGWAAGLPPLRDAEAVDPSMPATLLPLGLAQAGVGDRASALQTFARLTESDDLPTAWIDRAWLEISAGNLESGRRSLDRALRLGRQQPQIALAAGWIYEQIGEIEDSSRWYAQALTLDPRLAGDGFWQSPIRNKRWEDIEGRAVDDLAPRDRVNLLVSAGDLQAASRVLKDVPAGDTRALLELVISAWNGGQPAHDNLARWARDHPTDLNALAWSARVAAHAGDPGAAARYREWSYIVGGTLGLAASDTAIELPPLSTAPKAGVASVAWGIYTYRRPTLSDQILSDLPHVVYRP